MALSRSAASFNATASSCAQPSVSFPLPCRRGSARRALSRPAAARGRMRFWRRAAADLARVTSRFARSIPRRSRGESPEHDAGGTVASRQATVSRLTPGQRAPATVVDVVLAPGAAVVVVVLGGTVDVVLFAGTATT